MFHVIVNYLSHKKDSFFLLKKINYYKDIKRNLYYNNYFINSNEYIFTNCIETELIESKINYNF